MQRSADQASVACVSGEPLPPMNVPRDRFPAQGEIHVWHLDLTAQTGRSASLEAVLEPAEIQRANRFVSADHRRRFVTAQGALRCVLAGYLGTPPGLVRFEKNAHGKPRLAGTAENSGLVFNVSHSADRAVFAVGRDVALGIDIELRRPMRDISAMVERCFTQDEKDYWHRLNETERLESFFDLWTGKEAFVKAVGRGLGLGLTRCGLHLGSASRLAVVPDSCGSPEEWMLWRLGFDRAFSSALCARTRGARLVSMDFDRSFGDA